MSEDAASVDAFAAAESTALAAALLAPRPVSAESGILGGIECDSADCDATWSTVLTGEVESVEVAGDPMRTTVC